MKKDNHRVLIISNNVLSNTRNNGKTILSYFDCVPKEQVFQLYFSTEKPEIEGYHYYQMSDLDVLHRWFIVSRCGRAYKCDLCDVKTVAQPLAGQEGTSIPKNNVFWLMREVLWFHHWKSKQLLDWMDEIKPTVVFFVGGDCAFAYDICQFIVKRYQSRLTLYITDDYLISYPKDNFVAKIRKRMLRSKVQKCLEISDCFYTISKPMQQAYAELFGKNSEIAVNMPGSLKCDTNQPENKQLTLLYAGSIYYGRDKVLANIAKALHQYNTNTDKKKAILNVYTNLMPDEATCKMIEANGAARCCGCLGQEELKMVLNAADILVFVESFDEEQIRKTRFSLSTKIPEYLSVGKPILAVGPEGIGSIDYLKDTAFCITDSSIILEEVVKMLNISEIFEQLAIKSIEKYNKYHRKDYMQHEIIKSIMGTSIFMENSK